MKPLITFCCLITILFGSSFAQIQKTTADSLTQNQIDSIDSLFNQFDNKTSAGGVLCLVHNGKSVYQRAYGMANIEKSIPNTTNTTFNIGELSEQFIATALLLLEQRGKLSIEDDIRKYIPELPDYGVKVKIRNLLTLSSGLKDYTSLWYLGQKPGKQFSVKDGLKILARHKELNFKPGETIDFSASNYLIASLIIERVSGQSLKLFAEQNIFKPLKMKNTIMHDDQLVKDPNLATDYPINSGDTRLGIGTVHTSCNDFLLWNQNFYNPVVGGKDLIDKLTAIYPLNDGEIRTIGCGFGLHVSRKNSVVSAWGIGAFENFKSAYNLFLTQKYSIFCFANSSNANPSDLIFKVSSICANNKNQGSSYISQPVSSVSELIKTTDSTTVKPLLPENIKAYTGTYKQEDVNLPIELYFREIKVDKNNRVFYVKCPLGDGGSFQDSTELLYIGGDDFKLKGSKLLAICHFIRDKNNKVYAFKWEFLYQPTPESVDTGYTYLERYTPAAFNKAELSYLEGTYHSDELNTDYKIGVSDSTINLTMPVLNNTISFKRISQNYFYSKNFFYVTGERLELIEDKNNKVTGFYLSVDRTKRIKFVRKK